MLSEISEFVGMQVYTKEGVFLGNVNNVVLDVEDQRIDGLFVSGTNPLLVEGSRNVNVPYRWIHCIGDVIILKYFPSRVSLHKEESAQPEMLD